MSAKVGDMEGGTGKSSGDMYGAFLGALESPPTGDNESDLDLRGKPATLSLDMEV